MPVSSTTFRIAPASSSSTVSPMICKRSLYLVCSWIRSGISALHGPHHVAQKLSKTTLPWASASVRGLPSRSSSRNSGAGSGFRTKRMTLPRSCGSAEAMPANSQQMETQQIETRNGEETKRAGSEGGEPFVRPVDSRQFMASHLGDHIPAAKEIVPRSRAASRTPPFELCSSFKKLYGSNGFFPLDVPP